MEPILTTILGALAAGAIAKSKDIASQALTDAYDGLKSLIIQKLGKGGAVQSVEDDPSSEKAQAALADALAKKQLHADTELREKAEQLDKMLAKAKATGVFGAADIEIELVRGRVNATVKNLVATGHIRLNSVVAETGDATVDNLQAGGTEKN